MTCFALPPLTSSFAFCKCISYTAHSALVSNQPHEEIRGDILLFPKPTDPILETVRFLLGKAPFRWCLSSKLNGGIIFDWKDADCSCCCRQSIPCATELRLLLALPPSDASFTRCCIHPPTPTWWWGRGALRVGSPALDVDLFSSEPLNVMPNHSGDASGNVEDYGNPGLYSFHSSADWARETITLM